MSGDEFIEFELLGEQFKIKSDVPRDYFMSVVDYLRQKLDEMKARLPKQNNIRLLVFVALDIIDELFQMRKEGLNEDAIEKLTTLSEHLASVIDETDMH